MHGIRLNQITLGATHMAASVSFYQKLGLNIIVDSAPRYVRFEFPLPPDGGEPATLSLHSLAPDWQTSNSAPLIYFEVDDIIAFLRDADLSPIAPPIDQRYLWREADIVDPAGNRIRLYTAGSNRRFPPWRVE